MKDENCTMEKKAAKNLNTKKKMIVFAMVAVFCVTVFGTTMYVEKSRRVDVNDTTQNSAKSTTYEENESAIVYPATKNKIEVSIPKVVVMGKGYSVIGNCETKVSEQHTEGCMSVIITPTMPNSIFIFGIDDNSGSIENQDNAKNKMHELKVMTEENQKYLREKEKMGK